MMYLLSHDEPLNSRLQSSGFTLIEVLIATAVLAIALGASLESLSRYTASQARLSERYFAQTIAWDVSIEMYSHLIEAEGCQKASDGYSGNWQWAQQVKLLKIPKASEYTIPLPFTPRHIVLTEVVSDANNDRVLASLMMTCIQ